MKNRLWIILILLVLSSLACNLVTAGDPRDLVAEPTTVDPGIEFDQPSVTPPGGSEGSSPDLPQPTATEPANGSSLPLLPDSLDLSTLNPLPFSAYSLSVFIEYAGEDAAQNPLTHSYSMFFKVQDLPEPGESMHMITTEGVVTDTVDLVSLGGVNYTIVGGTECFSFGGSDSTLGSFRADVEQPDSSLQNEARLLERGVLVNNVMTDRYAVTQENFKPEAGAEPGAVPDFTTDEGSLYVAQQGRYIVRLETRGTMTADGDTLPEAFPVGTVVQTTMTYDIHEAPGDTWNLEVPAVCQGSAGSDSGYPMLEDASSVTQFQGQVIYTTQHSFTETMQFYREQMPLAGWTAGEESIVGTYGTLTFTRDQVTVTVTVLENSPTESQVIIVPLE